MLELNDSVRLFKNVHAGPCFLLNIIPFVIILSTGTVLSQRGNV